MLCGNLRSRGVSGSNAGGWGLKGGGVVMGCHSIVVYHPVDTPTPLFFFFFLHTRGAYAKIARCEPGSQIDAGYAYAGLSIARMVGVELLCSYIHNYNRTVICTSSACILER